MTGGRTVRVRAHAKINLSLEVVGRRDDGYHELRTVFQALALHDTLTFVARPGPFDLRADTGDLPCDRTNLVWRAAERLWAHAGREGELAGVAATLEKRVPMKGGLGGGSSDAASAVVALARLWDIGLDGAACRSLGRALGADVGFFFAGGRALGTGRGDEISPLPDLPVTPVLLVVPGFDVSTADAYRWVDEAHGSRRGQPAGRHENDFEPVVGARHPEVAVIKRALLKHGATSAALTGSGSAMFGLFPDEPAMMQAAEALARLRGADFGGAGDASLRIIPTRTLPGEEYRLLSRPQEISR